MDKEAMEHNPTIAEVENPVYPFLVSCKCAYQAHAKTQEQADYFKRWHQANTNMLKATKGLQFGHR